MRKSMIQQYQDKEREVTLMWTYLIVNSKGKVMTETVDFSVAQYIVASRKELNLHIETVKK